MNNINTTARDDFEFYINDRCLIAHIHYGIDGRDYGDDAPCDYDYEILWVSEWFEDGSAVIYDGNNPSEQMCGLLLTLGGMFVMQYGHVFNQLKGNEPDGTPDNYDEF
jgi:hypothetical protein